MKSTAENAANEICVRNRQRKQSIRTGLLRRIAEHLLTQELALTRFDLGICLVSPVKMTWLNHTYLGHAGSTDVITFNYASAKSSGRLHGEIFISVEDAKRQAREFRATWTEEIVRYLVHGVLHLLGYEDSAANPRRRMKKEEERHLKALAKLFRFGDLGKVAPRARDARRSAVFRF